MTRQGQKSSYFKENVEIMVSNEGETKVLPLPNLLPRSLQICDSRLQAVQVESQYLDDWGRRIAMSLRLAQATNRDLVSKDQIAGLGR